MTIGEILDLNDISAGMIGDVGGKAANLGELTRAGFPVPPGFCVTTGAYRRLAAAAGLDGVIGKARGNDLASMARARVLAAVVPDGLAAAIVGAYRALGPEVTVAVRSSATAEDLPFASFAGQQDTYLGVLGADAVLDAVRRCWASLWTDRAVSYRTSQGIDHAHVLLAVVVQTMVHSRVAGVLFTANPVTGRRREAVIDASPGLGEAVVSGAVTPDHLVVDTATRRILERRRGDTRFAIHARPGGGTQQVSLAPDAGLCVTDRQVTELAVLGDRVETHDGAPQDIEWAIDDDGTLWLTQARPITTLYPLPDPSGRQGLRSYFCFSVAQGLYRPLTPMGLAAFRLLASSAAHTLGAPESIDRLAGPPAYAEAGQRLFLDLTGVLRSRVGRAFMPRVLDLMEARSATVLRGLFDRPEFSVIPTPPRAALRRAARIAVRYRIPVRLVQAVISPSAAHRRVDSTGAALAGRLADRPGATPAQRLDHVETILFVDSVPLVPEIVPGGLAGFAMFGLAARLLRSRTEPGDLQVTLKGLPHNITTQMDLELWSLTQRVRGDDAAAATLRDSAAGELAERYAARELPPVLDEGLADFLARYGHRAVAEIDVGLPRWSEDPTHILGVLANYLRLDNPDMAPDVVFERSTREAEQMVERLASASGRLRGAVVRFALGRARQLIGIREMPKNNLVLALAAVRRNLWAVGAALAADGRIDEAGDIFWLSIAEARAGLGGTSLRGRAGARRESYDREMRRRRVPRVMLSDGTEPEATAPTDATTEAATEAGGLSGVPASPGTVTGTVRVILDPVGAQLQPGEILVAPSTDPGWTPLFLTAGGLVMEMGGPNSHGAVVAREYGIPAVVGVPMATDHLSTGDLVTVNGTAGTVTVDQRDVSDAGSVQDTANA